MRETLQWRSTKQSLFLFSPFFSHVAEGVCKGKPAKSVVSNNPRPLFRLSDPYFGEKRATSSLFYITPPSPPPVVKKLVKRLIAGGGFSN